MNAKAQHGGVPPLIVAPLPKAWYFVAVDGRPRRPETYPTQALAEKAARDLARYNLGQRVSVYRAEPVAAMRDGQ